MSALRLFTVFHGNLDFSALPDRDLPLVIERCYWPLLALAEEAALPLGLEMPARTLHRIADEDPEWLKSLRSLADRGLVELVASGWAQVVGPLAPVDVNRANLALGREAYAALLSRPPSTWFVNEQTFAAGLAPLYAEVGARSLVMEWNNPASRRPELRPLRLRPARLRVDGGEPLPLLWNDCVVFQKLQRAAQGAGPRREYGDAIRAAAAGSGAQLLCAYGGDLEIFDYRPGGSAPPGAADGVEMERLASCLRELAADPALEFRLPGRALEGFAAGPVVELASASDPLPCKKQPRYNPTRWAVSGRDGLGMNTQCFALRRELQALRGLSGDAGPADPFEARTLVELWGSDYRTRATEEKVEDFHARMGAARAGARAALDARVPVLGEGEDAVLVNASPWPWCGDPVEIELRLAPGRLSEARLSAKPAEALPEGSSQLEVSSRHRDGSVRSAILVVAPQLAVGGRVAIRLEPSVRAGGAARVDALPTSAERIRTGSVEASFLAHRGGALERLRFPGVDPAPLIGTLPHGSFDAIEYTPDFYSGHVVAVTEASRKAADLSPVSRARVVAHGPVRTSVEFRVETALGEGAKLYRLYHHQPRIDLVHTLHFDEARLNSLRVGIVTFLPDAFESGGLSYAAVNGGATPDVFRLETGSPVAQHLGPAPGVSASSCLGATEGWVSCGDGRRGVGVITDRAGAAAVPLLEYADVDGRSFLRVHHSVAETDETRATFFRGVRRFAFCIVAHRADVEGVRRVARGIERGLPCRTERGVGVARGL